MAGVICMNSLVIEEAFPVRRRKPGKSPVSDATRVEIARRRAAGERIVDLARDYGLTQSQVSNICTCVIR
jgi:transposase-like protein